MGSTGFLFARPNAMSGAAGIMDLAGALSEYNSSIDGEQANELAAWADWIAVGADMQSAIDIYGAEQAEQTPARDYWAKLL